MVVVACPSRSCSGFGVSHFSVFISVFVLCSLFIYLYSPCPSLNCPVGLCFWTHDMTSDWLPSWFPPRLPGHCRLVTSPSCPTRALSKNAVSFFLRDVIHGAEASRPEVGTVRAHDIRVVSTSVAFHRNWSVSEVLDAATWSSSSVFTSLPA